jgi:hypothetical protein
MYGLDDPRSAAAILPRCLEKKRSLAPLDDSKFQLDWRHVVEGTALERANPVAVQRTGDIFEGTEASDRVDPGNKPSRVVVFWRNLFAHGHAPYPESTEPYLNQVNRPAHF